MLCAISRADARQLRDIEIRAVRRVLDEAVDQETLLVLDFLEADQGTSLLPLETALRISATVAAGNGSSERQWIQQLVNRHGKNAQRLQNVWMLLEHLRVDGGWPWSH